APLHFALTTRFANSSIPHCGKCFGCLVRRIPALVAGVPDTQYAWDGLEIIENTKDSKIIVLWRSKPKYKSQRLLMDGKLRRFTAPY
ncbi:MAG: hypothetical protein DRN49_00115, partial [Thaumarchaeota archaeon]